MTTEHNWPMWASELFETIVASIESKGMGSFQGAYYKDEGTHQIEVAPALAQLARAGPDDGATVWALIHNVDLLAIQQAFDQVEAVGQQRYEIPEHMTCTGKTVQEKQFRRPRRTGFPVEDVETTDIHGAVTDHCHVITSYGQNRSTIC